MTGTKRVKNTGLFVQQLQRNFSLHVNPHLLFSTCLEGKSLFNLYSIGLCKKITVLTETGEFLSIHTAAYDIYETPERILIKYKW